MEELLVLAALFVVFLVVMRFFGAWLLRIDDVIDLLRKILDELQKQKDH